MIIITMAIACTSFAQTPNYWEQQGTPTQDGYTVPINSLVCTTTGGVFAGEEYGSVYCSMNDGSTWAVVAMPVPDSLGQIMSFSLFADGGGNLYSAEFINIWDSVHQANGDTLLGVVFKSQDNGKTWASIFNMNNVQFTSMAFISTDAIFIGTDSGVYHTTNGGGSWSYIDGTSGLGAVNISLLATDGNGNIIAQATSGSSILFRSTDDGQNWTLVGSGLNASITSILHYGNILYACSGDASVYSSLDTGATWNICKFTSNDRPISINCLVIDGSGNIFLGTTGGVYESTDSGKTCSAINKGLTNALQPPSVGSLAINMNDYLN